MSKATDSTDETDAQWTPRFGYGWGEGTQQARAARDAADEEPAPEWWTDAYEIRMRFGIPQFDPDAFDYDVYPDCLIHEKPATRTESAGGTDWLKVGERGCGKSTDNLHWSARLMDENEEKVVWRGSPNRSEWVPFADWTTLWLPSPEHASHDARWIYEDDRRASETVDDLEEVVRSVRYYDDVLDLVDELGDHPEGTFNVVYPDPSFAGCEELTSRTSRTNGTLPFVPEWKALGDAGGTPLTHWWYAFMLARIEFATSYGWMSWMFDEAADLVPPSVEQDDHRTHSKLMLYRNLMQDSRRERFSVYNSIHRESQINWRVREEHMWRVDMPDGTPNPRRRSARSIPKGFDTVPMNSDIMSSRDVGTALMFNERRFSLYRWSDIKDDDEHEGVLKLSLGEPEADESESDDSPTLQYEPAIFSKWRGGDERRLYAKDPGDGYIDLHTGQEIEPLESPQEGLTFRGVETREEYHVVRMDNEETGETLVVAKIPKKELGLDLDAADEQMELSEVSD